MSRANTASVRIRSVGQVVFRVLTTAELEDLKSRARAMFWPVQTSETWRIASLLISEAVISPQLTDEEFTNAMSVEDVDHLAAAILEASG